MVWLPPLLVPCPGRGTPQLRCGCQGSLHIITCTKLGWGRRIVFCIAPTKASGRSVANDVCTAPAVTAAAPHAIISNPASRSPRPRPRPRRDYGVGTVPKWDGRTTILGPGGWPGPPCGAAGTMALTQIPARARSPGRRSSRLNPGPDPRPSLPSQADRSTPSPPRQADGRVRATKFCETVKIKTAPQPVYTQALAP